MVPTSSEAKIVLEGGNVPDRLLHSHEKGHVISATVVFGSDDQKRYKKAYSWSYYTGPQLVRAIFEEYGKEGAQKFLRAYDLSRNRLYTTGGYILKLFERATNSPLRNTEAIQMMLEEVFGKSQAKAIVTKQEQFLYKLSGATLGIKGNPIDKVVDIGRSATNDLVIPQNTVSKNMQVSQFAVEEHWSS